MKKDFNLSAQRRSELGSGPCRRLRRAGKLPGILYGGGGECVPLCLDAREVMHHLDDEAFYSHILQLRLEDGKERREEQVVLKGLKRHPSESRLLHIDFQRIDENRALTMNVPLHFLNEDHCAGVKQGGGLVSHVLTEVEVSCLPRHLPEYIGVDIGALQVGETIHLRDLQMPEGVELYSLKHGGDPDQPVVSVHLPKVVQEEEETAGEEAEAQAEGAAPAAEESKTSGGQEG